MSKHRDRRHCPACRADAMFRFIRRIDARDVLVRHDRCNVEWAFPLREATP